MATTAEFRVGDRVQLIKTGHRGRVAYEGKVKFRPGYYIGVVLDRPVGLNNGMVKGIRYFDCRPRYGIFVRPQALSLLERKKDELSKSGKLSIRIPKNQSPQVSRPSSRLSTPSNRTASRRLPETRRRPSTPGRHRSRSRPKVRNPVQPRRSSPSPRRLIANASKDTENSPIVESLRREIKCLRGRLEKALRRSYSEKALKSSHDTETKENVEGSESPKDSEKLSVVQDERRQDKEQTKEPERNEKPTCTIENEPEEANRKIIASLNDALLKKEIETKKIIDAAEEHAKLMEARIREKISRLNVASMSNERLQSQIAENKKKLSKLMHQNKKLRMRAAGRESQHHGKLALAQFQKLDQKIKVAIIPSQIKGSQVEFLTHESFRTLSIICIMEPQKRMNNCNYWLRKTIG